METETITARSASYCGISGHVRVWAGSPEAAPDTCSCGSYRFVKHQCACGNVHEQMVMIDPVNELIRREWETPEEDEAWRGL